MAKEKENKSQKSNNSFPAMEEEVLDFWDKAQTFKKSVEKEAPQGGFIFYEGPPTANGLPGIHHVIARAFKDIIPRYKTMAGFRVERKAGWDTHGLPVELQVEKELGLSGKPEIEKYGIAKFNKKCRESVWQFKDEWEKLTRRIAFWVDMEKPYITYENYYIESLWWIIKQIYGKNLLYKGHKVVHHCPRCGTSLSSHEVAQGYKKVKENSVYIKFKLKAKSNLPAGKAGKLKELTGDDNVYILAWTTTPWTLPGNVALAVRNDIDYAVVKYNMLTQKTVGKGRKVESSTISQGIYILAWDVLWNNLKSNAGFMELRELLRDLSNPDKLKKDIIKYYNKPKEFQKEYDIKIIKGSDLVDSEYEPLFKIKSIENSGKKAYYVAPAEFVTTEDGTGVVHTAVMYGEDDYNLGEKIGLPKVHTVNEEGYFVDDLAEYGLAGKFVKDEATEKIIFDHLKKQGKLFKEEMYEHDYPYCWRCDTPLLYYAKDSWFIKMTAVRDRLVANNKEINWVPDHIKTGRFGEWVENVKDWAISRERYWGTPLPIWQCEECHKIKCIGSVKELGVKLRDLHRPYVDDIKFKCACGGEMVRDESVLDCWFDSGSMPFAQQHYPFENIDLIDKGEQYPADYICEAIDQTRGWFYTLLAVSTLLDKGTCYKNVICLGHINDKYGKKMSKSKGNIIDPWDVIEQFGVDAVRMHMYTINQPGEGKNYDLDDVRDVFRKNIMILWNVYKFYEMYASDNEILSLRSATLQNDSVNILDKWILARLHQLISKVTGELDKYHVYESAREIPEFINDLSTWYLRRSRDRFKSDASVCSAQVKDKKAALQTTGFVLMQLSKVMAPFMPFMAESLWQRVTGNNFQDKNKSAHLEKWPVAGKVDERIIENMNITKQIVEEGLAARDEAQIKVRQPLSTYYTTKVTTSTSTTSSSSSTTTTLPPEYLEIGKDELNVKEIKGGDKNKLDTKLTPELKQEGIKRELVRFINAMRKTAGLTIQSIITVGWESESEKIKGVIVKCEDDIAKATLAKEIKKGINDKFVIKKEVKVNGDKVLLGIIEK